MQQVLDRPLTHRERAAVLSRIQALMEFWDIRCDELTDDAANPVIAQPPPSPQYSGGIKYRHPETGETWDGIGQHPEWLRRALLHEGLRVDELRPQTVPPQEAQHNNSPPRDGETPQR